MKVRFLLLAIGCLLSAVSAQWLETTIPLSRGPSLMVYNRGDNKAYAVDDSGVVTVIDCATNSIVGSLFTGSGIWDACYNPTGDRVYFLSHWDNLLTIVDGAGDSILKRIQFSRIAFPNAVCWNPVRNEVYCAQCDSLTVVDGASNEVVRSRYMGTPIGVLCYNPVHNTLWCGAALANSILVLDAADDSVIAVVPTDCSPACFCCNPVSDKVYCGCYEWPADMPERSSIAVINGATAQVIATLPLADYSRPYALCFNPADNRAYCACMRLSFVTVIDGASNSRIGDFHLASAQALCYDSLNDKVYLVGGGDTVLVVYGPTNHATPVYAGVGSMSAVLNPIENRIYVADYWGSQVLVLRDSMSGIAERTAPAGDLQPRIPTIVRETMNLPPTSSRQPLAIYDINGRKVMDIPHSALRTPHSVDVSRLAPGVYFVRNAADGRAQKVVIQK